MPPFPAVAGGVSLPIIPRVFALSLPWKPGLPRECVRMQTVESTQRAFREGDSGEVIQGAAM